MRICVSAQSTEHYSFGYDYHYPLHSAIYGLIAKSSPTYAEFLHDTGFIDAHKHLKLFTYSQLGFPGATRHAKGFRHVSAIKLYFSTPIPNSLEHIILGIFSDNKLMLNITGTHCHFNINHVETLPEPSFLDAAHFTCLSPIAVSKASNTFTGKHFLDYMNPVERDDFVAAIHENLLQKYRLVHQKEFCGNETFHFHFDPTYIIKRQGRIRKNIPFKDSHIIGMEAPFTIQADPALIKIGYECGLGINNSAGFGMVEKTVK